MVRARCLNIYLPYKDTVTTERRVTPHKKVEVKICKYSNSIDQDGKCTNPCQQAWCTDDISCSIDCPVSFFKNF